jgi:DeoR/GlpR family transcriptional regulator of sugar metabolism
MIQNSAQTVLLTDSSKANQNSFMTYGTLDQVDCVVTDDGMPDEILETARRCGAETIVVSVGGENKA